LRLPRSQPVALAQTAAEELLLLGPMIGEGKLHGALKIHGRARKQRLLLGAAVHSESLQQPSRAAVSATPPYKNAA